MVNKGGRTERLCYLCTHKHMGRLYKSEFVHYPEGTRVVVKDFDPDLDGRTGITVRPVQEARKEFDEQFKAPLKSTTVVPTSHPGSIIFYYLVKLDDATTSNTADGHGLLKLSRNNLKPIAFPKERPSEDASGNIDAKLRGADAMFAGVDPGQTAQLLAAQQKVIAHHPTITAQRPCPKVWALHELQRARVHAKDRRGRVVAQYESGLAACDALGLTPQQCWGMLHGWKTAHGLKRGRGDGGSGDGGDALKMSLHFTAPATDVERAPSASSASASGGNVLHTWLQGRRVAVAAAPQEKASAPTVLCYSMGHNGNPLVMSCGVPIPPLDWRAGCLEGHSIFTCCMKVRSSSDRWSKL